MESVRVSKTDFIYACIYACRHDRAYEMIWVDSIYGIASSYHNPECDFSIGTAAAVARYCDDVFSPSAASQVLGGMNANDTWSEISRLVLDCDDIDIEWDEQAL